MGKNIGLGISLHPIVLRHKFLSLSCHSGLDKACPGPDPGEFGGGGYGLTKNLNKGEDDISDGSTLSFGYGGFELEYIFGSDKLVHGSIYTLIGGGSLSLMGDETDNHTIETNEYFVFEPDLNLELNVTKFFRIGLGVGYRVVAGDDFKGYNYLDLSGVTGTLTFKFGKF